MKFIVGSIHFVFFSNSFFPACPKHEQRATSRPRAIFRLTTFRTSANPPSTVQPPPGKQVGRLPAAQASRRLPSVTWPWHEPRAARPYASPPPPARASNQPMLGSPPLHRLPSRAEVTRLGPSSVVSGSSAPCSARGPVVLLPRKIHRRLAKGRHKFAGFSRGREPTPRTNNVAN
jgi:hypothetical protein